MINNGFSQTINVFHKRIAPERGNLVGYGAIIDSMKLDVPLPDRLSLIKQKHKRYNKRGWQVFTIKHQPQDTLYNHLVFALKYEGVNLLFFKKCLNNCRQLILRNGLKVNH